VLARIWAEVCRAVLTTWDYFRQPIGRPPQVPDQIREMLATFDSVTRRVLIIAERRSAG
jgi:hypothetical protein